MIDRYLKEFLKSYRNKRLVLGFSGGSDSMALFKALLAIKQSFVAAHIDHGWRDSSALEAEKLEKLCQENRVPFHLKRLKLQDFQGNLEASAREKRLAFFKEVLSESSSSAILMAHHADDLAETTLKKVFEGAFLPNLGSMTKCSEVEGLKILRPLIGFSKADLLSYLGEMPFINDETNLSSKLLRGRLRSELIPYLSKTFGKNVASAFVSLSEESQELKDYLAEELKAFVPEEKENQLIYDFAKRPHPYLLKKVIEKALRDALIPVRKAEIKLLSEAILERKSKFQRKIGGHTLLADKGKLIAPLNPHVLNSRNIAK